MIAINILILSLLISFSPEPLKMFAFCEACHNDRLKFSNILKFSSLISKIKQIGKKRGSYLIPADERFFHSLQAHELLSGVNF